MQCSEYQVCRGGCLAAKFFTGLPLDGPDPECVHGHGAAALPPVGQAPKPSADHSHRRLPVLACTADPLAGLLG
jgi:hypothetical protein